MAPNFVVAFGPNNGYYFSNKKKSIWNNVPAELSNLLKDDTRFQPDKVLSVSLGPNLAYFIKSKEAFAWSGIPPHIANKVKDLGDWSSVQSLLFASDPESCLIFNTNGQVFGNKLTQEFYDSILRYSCFGFQDLCFSVDGGYALTTKNNLLSYKNVPEAFITAWKNGHIAQVTTSAFDQFYFIEFQDGNSVYSCPTAWHNAIDDLRNSVPRTSSGTTTSSINQAVENAALASQLASARHRMQMYAIDSIGGGYRDRRW